MALPNSKTAIIVGAGVGGVASAARLAKAGFRVTVVEKNSYTGGRCSLLHHEGYRFDQGPSLLLLPDLFRETFADLDTTLEKEGVDLLKCEPNYEMYFGDGEKFTLSTDLSVMKREVEKWEGKDGFERYLGFMQEAHRHYEVSVIHVLKKNFYSLWSMIRPSFLRYIITLHPFESIHRRARKYFHTDRLQRVATFGSMYMGMSPYEAPGTYSLLLYTELAEGIWYPRGGFHKVVEAMVNIGTRLGVSYRLSTAVSSVSVSADGNTVTGVVLESGEHLTADVVVLNADLVYAYTQLLPPSSYADALTKLKLSCSSISFYWSMSTKIPELNAHNIFLANHYKESFDDIFQRQQLPEEPSFYVNVPSRVDATAAPEGKDAVVVLVPTGHMVDGKGVGMAEKQDWGRIVDRARKSVFETMKTRTGVSLEGLIEHEIVNSPPTWKETFNLQQGAILGLSHSFFNVLSFRPRTKHASLSRCYFVGASTHPGTGVPICLAGAKLTTEQVLEEFGIAVPWVESRKTLVKDTFHGKDTKHAPWIAVPRSLIMCLLLVLVAMVMAVAGG